MPSLLVICTANICRSPMVEVLLRRKLAQESVPGEWAVSSAGTWASDGIPASENGVLVMQEQGLDTSGHRSRVVTASLLAEADLILTMTAGHAESLRAEFPGEREKVYLFAEMAGRPYDIRDPYGRSVAEYRHTAQELADLTERGWAKIVSLAQGRPAEQ